MNWLISLVMAGIMFSSDGDLPGRANYNDSDSCVKKVAQSDETERFEQTYPLNARGRVGVSNVNGSITIQTWDREQVKLEYVKTANSRERLAEVEIVINARQDYFQVETDYDNWRRGDNRERRNNGNLQVEYRLTVPRNAVLDEIETVNGSISISNAANTTKASAVNGEVRAVNLRGTTSLSTVNGTVVAEFDQLDAASKISLDTVNGQVNLVIPSDANATVKADTVNGSISNDFGLPVRKGQYVGKDLYGRIGSGAVQIRLNSVNGGLSVRRKNDGKNPNPAIDLLQQKSSDEDWDDDEDTEHGSSKKPRPPRPLRPAPPARPNETSDARNKAKAREARKAMKEAIAKSAPEAVANAATVQAIEEATKEIAKINPVVEKVMTEVAKVSADQVKAQLEDLQKRQQEIKTRMSEANWFLGAPRIEKKSASFGVKGVPKVTVEARNCDVNVRGWDKSEVSYSMVRISRNNQKKPLNTDSAISVKATESEVRIRVSEETTAKGDVIFEDATKIRLEVFVPKKSNLKIITGGQIRLENVSGELELQGEDEAINVRDSGVTLRVSSSDGTIRIVGFEGNLESKTSDGMMNLDGNFQKLSAQTVDGTIILTLPDDANVNIESNRKDIKSDGVSLVYQGDGKSTSVWKVGKGGENYRLYTTADGQVFIRNANAVNTVWQ